MRRNAAVAAIAVVLAALSGCVERRFVVNSDPPGALVLKNGTPIGYAPSDDHFVYYGNYHFTLVKPGYATPRSIKRLRRGMRFRADLISENLWPWHIEDVRQFTYKLQPVAGPLRKRSSPAANHYVTGARRSRSAFVGCPATTSGKEHSRRPTAPAEQVGR